MAEPDALAFHKKRRGVIRSSLTKLGTKLAELEADPTIPTLRESAKILADKLKTLQLDLRSHQLAIIDRTDDEDALAEEQLALDDDEDRISELGIRIQRLATLATSTGQDVVRVANKQLTFVQAKLESISSAVSDLVDPEDLACTLEEYKDQVTQIKTELTALNASLLSSDVPAEDPIMHNQAQVDKAAFDCLLKIKKRLRALTPTPTKASETSTTKLPKLELPTFHGDILRWKYFWNSFASQYTHDRTFPRRRS